jgi:hypothetical protein
MKMEAVVSSEMLVPIYQNDVQTAAPLTWILQATGLNLGRDTGYTDFDYFFVFLFPSRKMPVSCLNLYHNPFLPDTFHVVNRLHSRRWAVWTADGVVE